MSQSIEDWLEIEMGSFGIIHLLKEDQNRRLSA